MKASVVIVKLFVCDDLLWIMGVLYMSCSDVQYDFLADQYIYNIFSITGHLTNTIHQQYIVSQKSTNLGHQQYIIPLISTNMIYWQYIRPLISTNMIHRQYKIPPISTNTYI